MCFIILISNKFSIMDIFKFLSIYCVKNNLSESWIQFNFFSKVSEIEKFYCCGLYKPIYSLNVIVLCLMYTVWGKNKIKAVPSETLNLFYVNWSRRSANISIKLSPWFLFDNWRTWIVNQFWRAKMSAHSTNLDNVRLVSLRFINREVKR